MNTYSPTDMATDDGVRLRMEIDKNIFLLLLKIFDLIDWRNDKFVRFEW